MIDISKSYNTKDGRRVKLFFIEDSMVHGFMQKQPEKDCTELSWLPGHWDVTTGESIFKDLGEDYALQEVKATKTVSHTFYIDRAGACHAKYLDPDERFALITINCEVEEGYDRVVTINEILK